MLSFGPPWADAFAGQSEPAGSLLPREHEQCDVPGVESSLEQRFVQSLQQLCGLGPEWGQIVQQA